MLTDAAGKKVATGKPAAAPKKDAELVVPLPHPLAAGAYTVKWHAVAVDSHKTQARSPSRSSPDRKGAPVANAMFATSPAPARTTNGVERSTSARARREGAAGRPTGTERAMSAGRPRRGSPPRARRGDTSFRQPRSFSVEACR